MKTILLALLIAATSPQAQLDEARSRALASPQSAEAQLDVVLALGRSPFYDQAWDALTRLQALDPDFGVHVADRYEALVVAEPGNADLRARLALGYYFRGDREAARRELERATEIAPGDPWLWDYLGFLQAEINKSDLAIASWKHALEADPDNALAHHLLALILFRQGHHAEAGEELAKSAKLRANTTLRP